MNTRPTHSVYANLALICFAIALIVTPAHGLSRTSAGLPQAIVPDGFGVNIHFTHFGTDELVLFKDAGFGLVRMDLGWGGIERTRGVYDFSQFDQLLADLDSVGARALLILDYGNPLYDKGLSPYTDAGREAFANYAAAAAAHFAGRRVIWEIWNEPNGGFWKPKADVDEYAALVKATVPAIRKADPHAIILAGATSEVPADFIDSLLRSGAMAGVTALSVHPYRGSNPETAAFDYARTRSLIARYTPPGQPLLPIICSEWGYSTSLSGISEQKQASYMVREYLSNLANGVNLTILYDWKNDGSNPADPEHRFGTLTRDLKPKPSYSAVKDLISSLYGYRFSHRLVARGACDWRLLFEGPTDLAVVEWSSKDNGPDATLPRVRKITPNDPEFEQLKQAASIQFSPDTRVALTSPVVPATVTVTNPTAVPATIVFANRGRQRRIVLAPRKTSVAMNDLLVDLNAPNPQKIDLAMTWNGKPINVIEPLDAVTGSLLSLDIAPHGADIVVDVRNPLTVPFAGRIALRPTSGKPIVQPLTLASGERKTITLERAAAVAGKIEVTDTAGAVWARGAVDRFVPKGGWPSAASQGSPYKCVFYLLNHPTSSEPTRVVATAPGAPASVAVEFPYKSGSEWRYYTLEPTSQDLIPKGAKALVIWANGDASRVLIRARIDDETGQTFQPSGEAITWKGWHPVVLPISGPNIPHWGGANDGVPHGQLHWSAFLLLDVGNLPDHEGAIQFAAPDYAMP